MLGRSCRRVWRRRVEGKHLKKRIIEKSWEGYWRLKIWFHFSVIWLDVGNVLSFPVLWLVNDTNKLETRLIEIECGILSRVEGSISRVQGPGSSVQVILKLISCPVYNANRVVFLFRTFSACACYVSVWSYSSLSSLFLSPWKRE